MGNSEKTCVLICAYNEEKKIRDIIKESLKYAPKVIVIDDGSYDKTATLARKAGAIVLSHKTNKGKGSAFKTGFKYIIDNNFEVAITLDGDGQHDPSDIPNLLNKLHEGYSIVLGTRNFYSKMMPLRRKIGNIIDSFIHSFLLGQKIKDSQCGYRVLTRKIIKKYYDKINEKGYFYELVYLTITASNGEKIGWHPIKTIYRKNIISKIKNLQHIFQSLRHYIRIIKGKYNFRKYPCLTDELKNY